jgi:hypothetical protein
VVGAEASRGKVRRSTWEVGEHGSGEVKGHAKKRQTPESRKVKGQVRKILRQVSLGDESQDGLTEMGRMRGQKAVFGQQCDRRSAEWKVHCG